MAGIYTQKPQRYYTPKMYEALRAYSNGKPLTEHHGTREALKSRGWIDRRTLAITERGHKFLQEHPEK